MYNLATELERKKIFSIAVSAIWIFVGLIQKIRIVWQVFIINFFINPFRFHELGYHWHFSGNFLCLVENKENTDESKRVLEKLGNWNEERWTEYALVICPLLKPNHTIEMKVCFIMQVEFSLIGKQMQNVLEIQFVLVHTYIAKSNNRYNSFF